MLKASDIRGFLWAILIAAAVAGVMTWRVVTHRAPSPSPQPPPPAAAARSSPGCADPAWQAAADRNAASLETLAWTPFGPAETGWATYAPLLAHEIASGCPPASAGFARAYAAWQRQEKRPVDGVFKAEDFEALRAALMLRRPFVRQTAAGACPAPPDDSALAAARPDEAYGGKAVRLRAGALAAYRRMVAAARNQGVGRQPPSLALVSGYRGPAEEAQRCAGGACNTLTRAHCSAHRTGLALDLYLEPASGQDPTSTAETNRRHMAGSPEYRWLVANAATFGFLPYPYEPWHWEWTGEPP
jgi:LAS superfamily LD-carboxypeptidase LdcB